MSQTDTRVDFYLLPGNSINALRIFCCRLAEKAWKLGHRVWIRTDDANTTRLLDDVLWSYHEGSFLPHAKLSDHDADSSPILIGESAPSGQVDLLINLGVEVPPQCEAFPRIAEIINDDSQLKQQGRLRYAHYDKNNYTLQHHTINQ